MRVLLGCVRLGFVHRFAYRFEVFTAFVSASLVVVLNASIWNAVTGGTRAIAGLSPLEVGTYVVVAWVATATVGSRVDVNLGNRFRTGQIAADLAKPLDLQVFLLGRDLGRALASLVVTGTPVILLAATLFPLRWPAELQTWPLLLVSLLLGNAIAGQIGFLAGLSAFYLKNVTGVSNLKAATTAVLSGAVVPLVALPDGVREVVLWLPFQGIAHTPTEIFLERLQGGAIGTALALQVAWALALLGLTRVAWGRAVEHLTVQGG